MLLWLFVLDVAAEDFQPISEYPTAFPTPEPTQQPTSTPFPTSYPTSFPTPYPTPSPTVPTTARQKWAESLQQNKVPLGGPTDYISEHMQDELHHVSPAPSPAPTPSPTFVADAPNFDDPAAAARATILQWKQDHMYPSKFDPDSPLQVKYPLNLVTVQQIMGQYFSPAKFDAVAVESTGEDKQPGEKHITTAQLDAMVSELIPDPTPAPPSFPPTAYPTPDDYINPAHTHCPTGTYLDFGDTGDLTRGKEEYRIGGELWVADRTGTTVAQSTGRQGLQLAECIKCPGGTYGVKGGLVDPSCSGICSEGYYCPEGSTSATEKPCGGNQFYCPAGSWYPQRVDAGNYSVGGTPNTRTGTQVCEPSAICRDGVQYEAPACPAGRYLRSSHDAKGVSENHVHHPERDSNLAHYGGTVTPQITPQCTDCPPGRFGSIAGLTSEACSGVCESGYYCPEGSVSSTERLCSPDADPSLYCPAGATHPHRASGGFYTVNARAVRQALDDARATALAVEAAAGTSAAAAAAAAAYGSPQAVRFDGCESSYDQTGGAAAYTGSHPCNEAMDGVVAGGRAVPGAGQGDREAQTSNGWAFTDHPGAGVGTVSSSSTSSGSDSNKAAAYVQNGLLQAVFTLPAPASLSGLVLLSGVGLGVSLGEEAHYNSPIEQRRKPVPTHHLTDFLVLVLTNSSSKDAVVSMGSPGFKAPPNLRFLPEDLTAHSAAAPPARDAYGSAYGSDAYDAHSYTASGGLPPRVGEPHSLNQEANVQAGAGAHGDGVTANRVRVRGGRELVRLRFDEIADVVAVKIVVLGTDTPAARGEMSFLLNEVIALRSYHGLRGPLEAEAEARQAAEEAAAATATAGSTSAGLGACDYHALAGPTGGAGAEVRCMAPWDATAHLWRACEVVSARPVHGTLSSFELGEGAWGTVKIHYIGHSTTHDEWVPLPSARVQCVTGGFVTHGEDSRASTARDAFGAAVNVDMGSYLGVSQAAKGLLAAAASRAGTPTTTGVEVLSSSGFGGRAAFETTREVGSMLGVLGSSGSSAAVFGVRTMLVPTAGAYSRSEHTGPRHKQHNDWVKGVEAVDGTAYGRSRRTHMVQCEAGYFCQGGERRPCPEGVYGSSLGLASARCSGVCHPGTYCPPATTANGATATRVQPAGIGGGNLCRVGHYCPDGKQQWPCPAGYYGAERGLVSPTCNGPCDPGHYCPPGSTSPREKKCPAGRYGDGSPGSMLGAGCSGRCPAGYHCPAGSVNPYARPCANPEFHCPEGTGALPLPTGNGFYALANAGDDSDASDASTSTSTGLATAAPIVRPTRAWALGVGAPAGVGSAPAPPAVYSSRHACKPGYYCAGGVRYLCPAGFYGNSSGLGPGPRGTYLLSTDLDSRAAPFVHPNASRDAGTAHAVDAAGNSTATAKTDPTISFGSHGGDGDWTLAGSADGAVRGGRVWPACTGPCAPGHYCPPGSTSMVAHKCPAGRYGSARGLATAACTGPCARGHYCPAGSTSATERRCPAGSFGTAEGMQTAQCLPPRDCQEVQDEEVVDGRRRVVIRVHCRDLSQRIYTSDAEAPVQVSSTHTSTADSLADTPRAGYLPPTSRSGRSPPANLSFASAAAAAGGRSPAGGGAVGGVSGRGGGGSQYGSRSRSRSQCAPGYYCPEASTHARARECGGAHVYCPEGSATPTAVAAGHYTVGGSDAAATRTAQVLCEPGHYCQRGVRKVCPAGRYGSTTGLHAPSCSGPCKRGHYCRAGSTSGEASVARVVGRRSPGRYHADRVGTLHSSSGRPTQRSRGRYEAEAAGPEYNARPAVACPAGRYGSQEGLESIGCEGKCDPGYYCPPGSTHPQQRACGHPSYYCPRGSASPTLALPGHYTVGDFEYGNGGNDATTRAAIAKCEPGTYCAGGVQYDCPAGTYASRGGAGTPKCEGLCYRGYYCPLGSTSPTEIPCPPGTYGATRGLIDASCSGPCMRGYDCPEASETQFGRRSTEGLNRL